MCEITNGGTISVIGAGPVGLCAMMCAKYMGAEKIIAIDIDKTRLKIAREQGLADETFTPETCNITNADGVIECAGTSESFQLAMENRTPECDCWRGCDV